MVTVRRAALRGVKVVAAAADAFRTAAPGIVVLIYHRVGADSGLEVDLPVTLFDEQCAHLAETATVLSLADAIRVLAGNEAIPPRAVVITFDDGTADFADHAAPVLARHGLPATLYLATDFVERQVSFPNAGTPLTWAALAEATSTGLVDIGSHTHTHRVLDQVDAAEAADELDRSVGLIRDRLGIEAADFAYPKGVLGSAAAAAEIARRFRSASIGGGRPNRLGGDPQRLLRTAVQVTDGVGWFKRKVGGGMALEDALRRRLNARRYAGAVS
jgi:peptidoglycan/xylan/chitin deacetylase (PgdA/CDA1 family)